MKTAIFIALVAAIMQVFGSLYYLLMNFDIIKYNATANKIVQPIFFLSNIGLLIFFIQLYDKESRK
jgi:hypothetical protein